MSETMNLKHARPRVVVVTGVSGAGRRTAAHALEDLGYYTVDNLPPAMLLELCNIAQKQGVDRVAVVVDVRSRGDFDKLLTIFDEIKSYGSRIDVLYVEASDEAIVKRQESARRPMPLQGEGPLMDGIVKERELLAPLRAFADLVIDTTDLNVHQFRSRVVHTYGGQQADELRLCLMSFGFKNGLPIDADMVFDVRFLPNPHWMPDLRPHSGLEAPVRDYVLGQPAALPYVEHAIDLITTAAAGYVNEGKRLVTIATGCTGGKHRSTAMTEEIGRRLSERGYQVTIIHRDLGLE
ncbi:MAG: RNase adapter RapZ [Propionibacteriaceae bacterium]